MMMPLHYSLPPIIHKSAVESLRGSLADTDDNLIRVVLCLHLTQSADSAWLHFTQNAQIFLGLLRECWKTTCLGKPLPEIRAAQPNIVSGDNMLLASPRKQTQTPVIANFLYNPVLVHQVGVLISFWSRRHFSGTWSGRYAHFVLRVHHTVSHDCIPNSQFFPPECVMFLYAGKRLQLY